MKTLFRTTINFQSVPYRRRGSERKRQNEQVSLHQNHSIHIVNFFLSAVRLIEHAVICNAD